MSPVAHVRLLCARLALLAASGCGDDEHGGCAGDCECSGEQCGGEDCVAACTGSGTCFVNVGERSSVRCTGSGDCEIACHGDCDVECRGSGDCVVHCYYGAECTFEACERNAIECLDGVVVCGGGSCS